MRTATHFLITLTTAALITGSLAACGVRDSGEKIQVSAGFYPLQYVAQRVGGQRVQVHNLTKPGAEPHDMELSPQELATVAQSKLALYVRGFQPALDAAIDQNKVHAVDGLPIAAGHDSHDHGEDDQAGDPEAEASASSASAANNRATSDPQAPATDIPGDPSSPPATSTSTDPHAGHDHSEPDTGQPVDPHFWLDPIMLNGYAEKVRDALIEIDPQHRDEYTANTGALSDELFTLDTEYANTFQTMDPENGQVSFRCQSQSVFTAHNAFSHLGQRYNFDTIGIATGGHEAEVTPARISQLAQDIRATTVSTLYAEVLASRTAVDTLARETGKQVATLDPIEGLTAGSAGKDYFTLMRDNLATLRTGQQCA